ncbi:protein kinase [Aureococcus anophagefferens]|nr:protein kinase [Aureococcus anophagefferens]
MFLSPVPGSPANEEPPSPPSVAMQDYYPQAKFGFGQMSMSDGDAMMASPANSRPRKQPKLGTPRTKGTPASCASTTTDICDSDGDVGDGVSDDEGDCGFSLRMPSGAGPPGLFGGGGGGAAMVDAPPAANVNPSRPGPEPLRQRGPEPVVATAAAPRQRSSARGAAARGLFGGGFGQAAEPAEAESRFRHDFEVVKCSSRRAAAPQRLVHLDIKPGNVFLKGEATFKLGDFGLATQKQSGGGDVVEGDSRYMSREPRRRDFTPASEKVDRDLTKCDVFSLGATAFELLKRAPLAPNGPAWHALRDGSPDFPRRRRRPPRLRRAPPPEPRLAPDGPDGAHAAPAPVRGPEDGHGLAVEKQHVQEYRADVARLSKQRLARSNTWA